MGVSSLHLLQALYLLLPQRDPLVLHVTADVLREVVTANESPAALWTLILLFPSVHAPVARQLIRAGESPQAAVPGAEVRLLPGVHANVRLQVGVLEVHFIAALVGAGKGAGSI